MSRSRLLRLFWRAPRTRMALREASVIPSPSAVSGEARPGPGRRFEDCKSSMECGASITGAHRAWGAQGAEAAILGRGARPANLRAAIQWYLPRSPVQGVAARACEASLPLSYPNDTR